MIEDVLALRQVGEVIELAEPFELPEREQRWLDLLAVVPHPACGWSAVVSGAGRWAGRSVRA